MQNNRCVCVIDVVVVVVVVVVVLVTVFVVIVVVAAAVGALTGCCLDASPVQLQTVLVSGCMLLESMLMSFIVAVCVVVCSVVVLLLLLLSELCNSLLNCRSAIFRCNFMQVLHVLASACHRHEPTARDNEDNWCVSFACVCRVDCF